MSHRCIGNPCTICGWYNVDIPHMAHYNINTPYINTPLYAAPPITQALVCPYCHKEMYLENDWTCDGHQWFHTKCEPLKKSWLEKTVDELLEYPEEDWKALKIKAKKYVELYDLLERLEKTKAIRLQIDCPSAPFSNTTHELESEDIAHLIEYFTKKVKALG